MKKEKVDRVNTINIVHFLIKEDGHRTVDEIEHYFKEVECNSLSHDTIMKIIHEELKMLKVCAQLVPKLVTDVPKVSWMAAAIEFLTLYHQEGEGLSAPIVTDDKKLVYHYTPEMKQASMMWKWKEEQMPAKGKCERWTGKVYLITIGTQVLLFDVLLCWDWSFVLVHPTLNLYTHNFTVDFVITFCAPYTTHIFMWIPLPEIFSTLGVAHTYDTYCMKHVS